MVSELLRRGAYAEANVSAEDCLILAGLSAKSRFNEIMKSVPQGTPRKIVSKVIEEKMGADYKKLRQAEKKLAYLIRRAEEIEGLEDLKAGRFETYRAVAYPVVTRIIAVPGVGFQLGNKEEFNDIDNALFLTHRKGFCDNDSDFRAGLIDELKKAILTGTPGKHITQEEEGGLSITFRLTVEKYR